MSDKQENGRALSPEQRQLITHYIETRSYVDAYRRVHPDCDNDGHRTTVAFRAARAFTKPMREEIARLDDIAKEAEQKAIERSAKEAAKLWSKFDSVKSYVNLVKRKTTNIIWWSSWNYLLFNYFSVCTCSNFIFGFKFLDHYASFLGCPNSRYRKYCLDYCIYQIFSNRITRRYKFFLCLLLHIAGCIRTSYGN